MNFDLFFELNFDFEKKFKFDDDFHLLDYIINQQLIEEKNISLQVKVWLTDILSLTEKYTNNIEFIKDSINFLPNFGKKHFSEQELGILEPNVEFYLINSVFID